MFNNTDSKKVESSEKKSRPEKGTSRKENKPKRVPISGDERDILSVIGKDEDYEYHWVLDRSEEGTRIMRFLSAEYEFVDANKIVVGDTSVYSHKSTGGSIVRVPANREGDWLYLMRIPKELHSEDRAMKARKVDSSVAVAHQATDSEGQYVKDFKSEFSSA